MCGGNLASPKSQHKVAPLETGDRYLYPKLVGRFFRLLA